MESELERVSAEIEEATRCMGDGFEEQAADHLATAAALLEALVNAKQPASQSTGTRTPLGRIAAA
jgi:hypothetical protein